MNELDIDIETSVKQSPSCCARLMQTLCVATFIAFVFWTFFAGSIGLIALCFSIYTCWIPILYFVWYIYDLNASEKVCIISFLAKIDQSKAHSILNPIKCISTFNKPHDRNDSFNHLKFSTLRLGYMTPKIFLFRL